MSSVSERELCRGLGCRVGWGAGRLWAESSVRGLRLSVPLAAEPLSAACLDSPLGLAALARLPDRLCLVLFPFPCRPAGEPSPLSAALHSVSTEPTLSSRATTSEAAVERRACEADLRASLGLRCLPAAAAAPDGPSLVAATDDAFYFAQPTWDHADEQWTSRLYRLKPDETDAWAPPRVSQVGCLEGWEAVELGCGRAFGVLRDRRGRLAAWGQGSRGELGQDGLLSSAEPLHVELLSGLSPVGSVGVGGWHCVAVLEDGDVYGWGWDEAGQLGLPSGQGSAAGPSLLDVPPARAAVCGARHSLLLLRDGAVLATGHNERRQLGPHLPPSLRTWTELPLPSTVSHIHAHKWSSIVCLRSESK